MSRGGYDTRTPEALERARIRRAQAPALRNLRVLLMPACIMENIGFPGCKGGKHSEDCAKGIMLEALRELRAATRRSR